MDYRKFLSLLDEGEKAHIDFKIRCDAFATSSIVERGELAKDICAMANNGNRLSHIIIGVSDDGRSFRSLHNDKLTDDNLQNFCKRAILPPPKITLHRKSWKRALPAHRGKEFAVIQVGPNLRQAFRLAQDFIDYRGKICYRRNEVWIRRNATTDLATPEEIVGLVRGQRVQDVIDTQTQLDRDAFSQMSQSEQRALIDTETENGLQDLGYAMFLERDWWKERVDEFLIRTLWKKVRSTAILVCAWGCFTTLTLEIMRGLPFGLLHAFFLPKAVSNFITRKSIKSVRRVHLIPVLRSVPTGRIAQAFPTLRKVGAFLHYYRPDLESDRLLRKRKAMQVPSSTEILIMDQITSLPEYNESLIEAIKNMERESATVVEAGRL